MTCAGRTVLSLFDYSGNWPRPYVEAGARVIQIDLKHGGDVLDLDAAAVRAMGRIDGILAAPPCTAFARSGAQYWKEKDRSGETATAVALIRQVLRCVEWAQPTWWVIENPIGRLNATVPELARFGPWYFQPCDFGDPYTKRTGLWGCYTPPLPLFVGDRSVLPNDAWLMKGVGGSGGERTRERRSATPMGFARAFFDANHWA